MMRLLSERKAHSRNSGTELKLLDDFCESSARIKELDWKEGMLLCTKREYWKHWEAREGWSKKFADKQWEIDIKKKGSFAKYRKSDDAMQLGVEKQEEFNRHDKVSATRQATGSGAHSKETMMGLAKGMKGVGSAAAIASLRGRGGVRNAGRSLKEESDDDCSGKNSDNSSAQEEEEEEEEDTIQGDTVEKDEGEEEEEEETNPDDDEDQDDDASEESSSHKQKKKGAVVV